jgi:acyl carrier protein
VYVVDERLRPVPVGVPGELVIGGVGVARGYLKRPELTAERFVEDRLGPGGGRLYRTGDLARLRADGTVEYLGRPDSQVKVRGYRIELGEVEAAVRKHPAVEQAAVVVREDSPGDKRLVAYVVPSGSSAVGEIRAALLAQLPEYMVPAAFVTLERLPHLPNGKLDRKALPAPESRHFSRGAAMVAPRTPLEEQVAGICAELLKVPRVGIHDNFFSLGGHSLLATQVVARLRSTFKVNIPLRALFDAPTVAGLAEAVLKAQQSGATLAEPALRRRARGE